MMKDMDALFWERLKRPEGRIDVVLDTDTYNEIDDQFALAYLLRSGDKLNVRAIYAAPFYNEKSEGPADGMEKSYQEILRILELMGRRDLEKLVYRGSCSYLKNETEPVHSPAAEHLMRLAMEYTPQKPLYVAAIGAITNVASALLMQPEIRDRIVLVWLGGNAHGWPDNREFNLMQDVAAARVVFGCGAALVQLPCMGVVSSFTTCEGELERFLRGKNALCDYLTDLAEREGAAGSSCRCWTRVIWDVTVVGWLLNKGFTRDVLVPAPIPQYDHRYSFDPERHPIRYIYHIERDRLFEDLFRRLADEQGD